MTSPGPGAPATTDTGQRTRYRPELQGLRALAVALVVVYHVWFNRVSGGVDVFFLISGFLVTGGLYRSACRGPLDLRATWSRQLSRLLPAAGVVLLASVAAGALLLPESRWLPAVREIVTSTLFLHNWQLAADSVDYAAQNDAAGIAQHFWSLSVQGQFYLVWPLLVALVALVARRDSRDLHRTLTVALAVVGGASLLFSVWLTALDQPLAYFHSLTRVWEFALGGLLALWITRIEELPVMGVRTRVALGWTGVAALVSCGFLLPVQDAFPGWVALWPTLAAALVLTAGRTGHRFGADRLLVTPLMHRLGDISFPLYLWHWPILILTLVLTGWSQPGLVGGLGVIAAALVLAVLTHRFVEQPLQRARPRVALRTGLAMAGTVLLLCGAWQGVATVRAQPGVEVGSPAHPGAGALDPTFTFAGTDVDDAPLLPSLVQAGDDWSYRTGTWLCGPSPERPEVEVCRIPPPGDAPPERTVAVIGDSHAQQYTGALIPIAAQRNWELVVMFRGACPFSTASEVDPADEGCTAWNALAADELTALQPDAVFTLASRDVRPGQTEQTPPGFVAQWWRMHDAGIPVVGLRDNPRPGFSVPDCVSGNGRHADACGLEREAVYPALPSYTMAPDVPPNVSFVDMADHLCDARSCPSEVGNVLVYMDDNHLTSTFTASLAPVIERHLETTLGW
ncbi:peptidoglycan/LPS O-acetylase OafA/YrhL [Pseudonocardia sediminis]|uniref:Peptidoglycan/LPS O-acetylase OafA/YrhL n=1 Tax=Pseudonocardia sediminis TaxID=1397368 RepID=A0A4Q7URG1_PSEST|nr:acyltransferase family protein [Pseudonocardia sediminis]RZT84176.1 peptidoglycan/LPS O-acetylase OafA/YrhL [Pseudonocardia sediminis]